MRSNGAVESGRLLITANDGGQDFGKVVAMGVRLDTFQDGIYERTLELKDQQTVLSFESYGVQRRVRLTSMLRRPTAVTSDADGQHLTTVFDGADGLPLEVIRVVTVSNRDLNTATLQYYIGLPDGVRPRSIVIGTGGSDDIVVAEGGDVWMYGTQKDGDIVPLAVRTSWAGDLPLPAGANGFLRWRRASVVIDAQGGDRRIPYTQALDPRAILADEGIRYIIDRNGDGASFPIIRQLGLTPVYENEEYHVYDVTAP